MLSGSGKDLKAIPTLRNAILYRSDLLELVRSNPGQVDDTTAVVLGADGQAQMK